MKWIASWSFVFFLATPFTSGAQSLEDRVRVLWDRSYSAPDSVLQEARQLLQEARAAGSYHAEVNALELQGEAHFYLLDLDSCRHYYQQALGVAQRKEDLEEQAHIHTSLGSIHSEFGERDASLSEFRQALTIWESLQDTVQLCGLEVRIGGALDRFDLDDLSMQHFVHALRHCADCGDSLFYAHALNGIGVLHKKQRNYLKALAVMDSARVIYARQGEAFGQGGVLNNLGVVYKSLGRYEEARRCYEQGLAIFEADGYDRGIMSFAQNLGILENLEGRPDKGLAHCSRALAIANSVPLASTQSEALNEIAKSLLMLDRKAEALDSIDRAIAIAADKQLLEKEQQAWATRSEVLEAMGRPAEALTSLRRHLVLHDSLFTRDKSAEIDRLQTVYETEQREATITHLEEQARLEQDKRRWLRIGIVAMGISAVVIVLALLQRRRKERQLLRARLELQDTENQRLQEQLDHKRRELTEKALHLAQKNELLRSLEQDIEQLRNSGEGAGVAQLAGKIRFDQQIDQNWDQFTLAFTETRRDFFRQLTDQHPDLTRNELRLAALLSMNLASKEIGSILNISDEGVKKARYRLRKKLGLRTEEGLEPYLAGL